MFTRVTIAFNVEQSNFFRKPASTEAPFDLLHEKKRWSGQSWKTINEIAKTYLSQIDWSLYFRVSAILPSHSFNALLKVENETFKVNSSHKKTLLLFFFYA